MPYRNKEQQKAAQRRWYERNKDKISAKRKAEREPRREYVQIRRADLAEYVTSLKKDIPCLDCGNVYHPVCMDFDHVRGTKVATIRHLINLCASKTEIDVEIQKCELVCSNCHRLRTFNRRKS